MEPEDFARRERDLEPLTLRDTFAAAALTGLLAHQTQDYGIEDVLERAEWAYEHADAMLEARAKKA